LLRVWSARVAPYPADALYAQSSPPPPPAPAPPAPPPAAAAEAAPAADSLDERLQALKSGQSRDAAARASPAAQPAPEAPDEGAPAPPAGNLLNGAIEEAGLITWPTLKGVVSTTAAVFAIVVVSTLVLLSVNALLATLSDKLFG